MECNTFTAMYNTVAGFIEFLIAIDPTLFGREKEDKIRWIVNDVLIPLVEELRVLILREIYHN
jgi:hypothetical protein